MQPQPNTTIEPQTTVFHPENAAPPEAITQADVPSRPQLSAMVEGRQSAPPSQAPPVDNATMEPLYTDQLYATQTANSMIEEPAEKTGWFRGVWGVALSIVLLGPVVGLYAWWVWGKSPFATWIKIVATLLPLPLIYLII